jgi:hypothetical protein
VVRADLLLRGAILLSGFWSLMAESFYPHSAKQMFGLITAAGTLGAISGGLMAERIAAVFSTSGVLLLLAALHLACSGVLGSLPPVSPRSPRTDPRELLSPVELFRRAPYLRAIAVLALAATSAAAILDYLFKAGAGAALGKAAAALLRRLLHLHPNPHVLHPDISRAAVASPTSDRTDCIRLATWRGSRRPRRLTGPDLSRVSRCFARSSVHTGSRGRKACRQNSDRRRLRPRWRCARQRDRAVHAVERGIVYSLWAVLARWKVRIGNEDPA